MSVKFIPEKKIALFIFLANLLFCGFVQNLSAQSNQIDQSFNTSLSNGTDTDISGYLTLQPDGKILIYKVNNVNGVARPFIARLNSDGSLDDSFLCNQCSVVFTGISSAVVQPDGKIIVAGTNNGLPRIYRFNSDGSLDNSYVSALNSDVTGVSSAVRILAAAPDGRAYGIKYSAAPFVTVANLNRLNNDGSIDTSFATLNFNIRGGQAFGQLKVLPDGKVLIGGAHTNGFLFRLNTDGSKDTAFESPVLTYDLTLQIRPQVTSFDVQDDGKIDFGGYFTTVNGVERNGVARLNANQGLDFSFNPSLTYPLTISRVVKKVRVQPDQKILVEGDFANGVFFRFNQDGTADSSFAANFIGLNDWSLDASGKIVYYGQLTGNIPQYGRLNVDGTIDVTFRNPVLAAVGSVQTLAVQTDQKIIISGTFSKVNNVNNIRLARLNPDGTADATFDTGSGPNSVVSVIALQNDGKILIGGIISSYNGTPIQNIARLNANGSLDNTFTAAFTGGIDAVSVQSDGKILVGGSFTNVNGQARNALVRLNTDGSLDNSFSVILNSAAIRSIVIESGGKITVGGIFSGINGFARTNIARLNSDGSTDTGFNAGNVGNVNEIIRQPDGKYLIRSNQIFRLNPNGSADTGFQTTNFTLSGNTTVLSKMLLHSDGSIIVGGTFDKLNDNPRKNIVRLKPNGNLDKLFLSEGANSSVLSLALQADGKTVIGGNFSSIGNITRTGIARLQNVPLRSITPFDFDGDGQSDIGVFRPSNFVWYQLLGSNYQFSYSYFGASGDVLTPADFDGDGKTDISIFRPSSGIWVYAASANNNLQTVTTWGQSGDVPLPSDVDGDGKADFVVFRPANRTWYRLINGTSSFTSVVFGAVGDQPVIGDFDGDGKSDPAVFRPSTGEWFYAASSQNGVHLRAALWGLAGDKLVPADYDGDGKTDAAIFRNGLWAIYNSSNNTNTILTFGQAGDKPVAADYDGDGRADVGVYRPADGTWYLLRSTSGFQALTFGANSDLPIQNSFVQ
ncbi:MAG: FG-GAP-like repeat-containing protein [Pyrinomonadaceae bacterium]|nr:FG-GAP-like repeat-containing protein [Pyrinomonadaceae bacterium]